MALTLRPGTPADAPACGEICYRAFAAIAQQHNFPPDLPSPEVGVGLASALLSRDDVYSVVAESDGRVLGSNFLWSRPASPPSDQLPSIPRVRTTPLAAR